MKYWEYDSKGNIKEITWTGGDFIIYTTEQEAIDDQVNALRNLIKKLSDKLHKAIHG